VRKSLDQQKSHPAPFTPYSFDWKEQDGSKASGKTAIRLRWADLGGACIDSLHLEDRRDGGHLKSSSRTAGGLYGNPDDHPGDTSETRCR